MEYTYEMTLDLNSNNSYPVVSAKQYDQGSRYLKIHLTKNNIDYPIDPSHQFYFRMRKPDGHGVINPATVELTRIDSYQPLAENQYPTEEKYLDRVYAKFDTAINNYRILSVEEFFEEVNPQPNEETFVSNTYYYEVTLNNFQKASVFVPNTTYYLWQHPVYDEERHQPGPYYQYTGEITDSAIRVVLTAQTLAVAGRGYADVVEYDANGNILSSISFIVNVMASPDVAGEAVSSSEFAQLTALMQESEETILNSQEWAIGSRSTSETPSPTNNALYYSQQAAAAWSSLLGLQVSAATTSGQSITVSTAFSTEGYSMTFNFPDMEPTVSASTTTIPTPGANVTLQYSAANSTTFFLGAGPTGEPGANGVSAVAVSSSAPTEANVNVWINPSATELGTIDAGEVLYSAESHSYEAGTVGAELQRLSTAKEDAAAAKSTAEVAYQMASEAKADAADVSKKITNPTQSSSFGILTTDASNNISWSSNLDIQYINNAPVIIASSSSAIALTGQHTPQEFGLAPANPNSTDGTYYTLPSDGISFDSLSTPVQNQLSIPVISSIYLNNNKIEIEQGTYNTSLQPESTLEVESVNFNIFSKKVNYKEGKYTLSYSAGTDQWSINGIRFADNEDLSSYGVSIKSGSTLVDGDIIIITYDNAVRLNNILTNASFVNPNYVDNAWFTINQRDIDTFENASIAINKYICDRWKFGTSVDIYRLVTRSSDGLSISDSSASAADQENNFIVDQILDSAVWATIANHMVTMSIYYDYNKYASKSFTCPGDIVNETLYLDNTWKLRLASNDINQLVIQLIASNANSPAIDVQAIKLELGDISTLALEGPPNYDEELKKCQRYFVQYSVPDNTESVLYIGEGQANTTTGFLWGIPLQTRMISSPEITSSVGTTSTATIITCNALTTTATKGITGVMLNTTTFYDTPGNTLYAYTTSAAALWTANLHYFVTLQGVEGSQDWLALSAEPVEPEAEPVSEP